MLIQKIYVILCHLGFCLKCSLMGGRIFGPIGELFKALLSLIGKVIWCHGDLEHVAFWGTWLVVFHSHRYIYVMRHILIKWSCPIPFLSLSYWGFHVGFILETWLCELWFTNLWLSSNLCASMLSRLRAKIPKALELDAMMVGWLRVKICNVPYFH